MRLPENLYESVKQAFDFHNAWHFSRNRKEWIPQDLHRAWEEARAIFPDLKYLDEEGCGEEFLQFHRHMVKIFKWLVDNTDGHDFTYTPWSEIPDFVETVFINVFRTPDDYVASAQSTIDSLVTNGSLDDLGNFIEATNLGSGSNSANIHNLGHGAVATFESQDFPDDETQNDASMGFSFTAHHNEHFWGLHGWIDEIFAD